MTEKASTPEHQFAFKSLMGIVKGANRFIRKRFDNVIITGLQGEAVSILQSHPTAIISTHRSHTDYFLLGSQLHLKLQNRPIRFAAGDNLTTLPYLGKKLLSWGAFPVSRDRAKDRSYLADLCFEFSKMLEANENIIVFPEGGRSYNGEMMDILQGVIGAAIISQGRDFSKDFYYLPVGISYERLPELLFFDILQKGKAWRKPENNSLKRFMGSVLYFGADLLAFAKLIVSHRLGIKYGDLYIDVGKPILVKTMVDIEKNRKKDAANEFWAHRQSFKETAPIIREKLLGLYRLLPMHIVAKLLEDTTKASIDDLAAGVDALVKSLDAQGRNCLSIKHLEAMKLVNEGIRQLRNMKCIKVTPRGIIAITRPQVVSYYSASVT